MKEYRKKNNRNFSDAKGIYSTSKISEFNESNSKFEKFTQNETNLSLSTSVIKSNLSQSFIEKVRARSKIVKDKSYQNFILNDRINLLKIKLLKLHHLIKNGQDAL